MARRWLLDLLAKLKPQIETGVPVVVLEPSCWAVFKDELTNILPNDRDGQRLQANVFLLADFLRNKAPHYRVPKLRRKALLHGHCHQKALDHLNDKTYGELFNEKAVLHDMGVQFVAPADGCCGMAGAFGFEQGEHYDVSVKCGERAFVPKVRDAADDELIIADGFSCREQISQMTGRQGLHMAQVLQMALHDGPAGPRGGLPELAVVRARRAAHRNAAVKATALLVAGAVIGGWLYRSHRRRARAART
jgi:Fe-S oxidoreductase